MLHGCQISQLVFIFDFKLLSQSQELQLKCLMKPCISAMCACVCVCLHARDLYSYLSSVILFWPSEFPEDSTCTYTHSHTHSEQHRTWKSSKSNLQHMDYIVQIELALKAK